MEKSLFEQVGGTYTQVGDYLLPNLTLTEEAQKSIGIWGQQHARYLKQYHKVIYYNYLTSGKLNAYLADIDEQAEEMFSRLVKDMADKQGIAENLKATDQMAWVGKMNNIRNAASQNRRRYPPPIFRCGLFCGRTVPPLCRRPRPAHRSRVGWHFLPAVGRSGE